MDSTDLFLRARWSYEMGRLRVALPGVVAAVAVIAYVLSRPHLGSAPLFAVLLLLGAIGAGVWRRVSARAVLPGMVAGLAPIFAPLVAVHAGVGCGLHDCTQLCLVGCLVGGLAAGIFITWRSTRLPSGRRLFLAAAGGIGTLAGALGCLEFGAIGLLLLLAGFAVILSPAWAFAGRSIQTS